MEINEKKLREQSQNKYISTFPIFIVLFIINMALYVLVSHLVIYGFFIIGILEYHYAKKRIKYLEMGFLLNFLAMSLLLLPGVVALLFNNHTVALPIGIIGILIILLTRIYLMLTKDYRRSRDRRELPSLFSVEVFIILLLSVYLINFYNYKNKIIWETKVSSGITSTLKFEDDKISFLTNDDFLMRKFYNFPQTYILEKKSGKVENLESGYKFSEEFKPFTGEVKGVTVDNIYIEVVEEKLYIRNLTTGKLLIKFIATGKIVTTPKVVDGVIYFATNGKVPFDKVKRTRIYALDFKEIFE